MYDGWSNQISHAARPIRKHCPDLGSDASSVWNFWARFSDVIWRGNQWWRAQMSAVFSSYDDRTGQKFDLDFNVYISVRLVWFRVNGTSKRTNFRPVPYRMYLALRCNHQTTFYNRLKRHLTIPTLKNKSEPTMVFGAPKNAPY